MKVVTCFLRHRGKILLMKRSNTVRNYKGVWGVPAGYIEDYDDDIKID